jgi:hypothetical protein
MPLKIIGTRLYDPSIDGYPDKCRIEDDENGMIIWQSLRYSTNPNPYRPSDGKKWNKAYAQLAPGEYRYECMVTGKHGKCIMLNDGGACPTTNKNFNPDTLNVGAFTAYACEIHEGFRGGENPWRGSSACQTVDPEEWSTFISHFEIGDKGIYILVDESKSV